MTDQQSTFSGTRLWIRTIMIEKGYNSRSLREFDALSREQFELWLFFQDRAEWELS